MIVPEFIIHNTIEGLIQFLRDNYDAATDKTTSYLYLLTTSTQFERYNFFDQAVTVLITNDMESTRYLQVDLGFNKVRDAAPSIYITMPSESPFNSGIGGSQAEELLTENIVDEDDVVTGVNQRSQFRHAYSATYDVVITSNNTNELLMLYHILKGLLKAAEGHLALSGLRNMKIAGQDLQPYMQEIPNSMYVRAIRLTFDYETETPDFYIHKYLTTMTFNSNIETS